MNTAILRVRTRIERAARRAYRALPHDTRVRVKRAIVRSKAAARRVARRVASTRTGGELLMRLGVLERPTARPFDDVLRSLPMSLDGEGQWFRFDVEPEQRYLLTVETAEVLDPDERAAVIQYRHINDWGRQLRPTDTGKAVGKFGAHDWIPRTPVGHTSRYVVFAPRHRAAIDIRLRRLRDAPVTVTSLALEPLGPQRVFAPYRQPATLPPRSPLRIALIADTFTATALRLEAEVLTLSATGWQDELERFRPDLLLVESAWNGNDGAWLYAIADIKQTDRRLADLTESARRMGVPSLFWNKEDPAHYDDFIAAARLCDVVATTDVNVVQRYRTELGHDRVFALPFCIQPDIHNPRQAQSDTSDRIEAAVFLGSWWASKFDERRTAQEQLFSGAADHGLEIFDRYLTWDDHERYRFAPEWLPYVHGTLTYDQALTAYRRYRAVLNVNTVTDSETMFSRRALEAAASGAVVVSNPSLGTTAALGDLVRSAATAEECSAALAEIADPDIGDLIGHLGYRLTHRRHTWADRLADVATHCNLAVPPRRRPKVSAVLATKRPDGADRILRYLAELDTTNYDLEAIVITAFDPAVLAATEAIDELNATVLQELPGETLGECLNRGAAVATGNFIAKVDDDDIYGPRYFDDLLLAADYSRADLVGKRCHYQYFEVGDQTVLRYPGSEHRFTDFVCGSTLLARATVYEKAQFPTKRVGEDTEFLRRVKAAGLTIFSADKFNYVSQRRADIDSHTWQEDHTTLLQSASTRRWGRGLPWDHITA